MVTADRFRTVPDGDLGRQVIDISAVAPANSLGGRTGNQIDRTGI